MKLRSCFHNDHALAAILQQFNELGAKSNFVEEHQRAQILGRGSVAVVILGELRPFP